MTDLPIFAQKLICSCLHKTCLYFQRHSIIEMAWDASASALRHEPHPEQAETAGGRPMRHRFMITLAVASLLAGPANAALIISFDEMGGGRVTNSLGDVAPLKSLGNVLDRVDGAATPLGYD